MVYTENKDPRTTNPKTMESMPIDGEDNHIEKGVEEGESDALENKASQEVREQAIKGSKEYFQSRLDEFNTCINKHEDRLLELIEDYSVNDKLDVAQWREALQLSEEWDDWDDTIELMHHMIKKMQPLGDSQKVLDTVVDGIKKSMNPDAQTLIAVKQFDAGNSWYHTTNKGKNELKRIKADVNDESVSSGDSLVN